MKSLKFLLPVFMGTLVYTTLSICIGPRGMWAMKQLSAERQQLADNLESLHEINSDLDARFQSLSADPDAISVYAHELGYVYEGERLIKLAGFTGGIDRTFDCGSALSVSVPRFLPEWLCKFFGFFTGFCSFLLFSFIITHRNHDYQKRRS
jgi:cell division protein FtsB